MSNGDTKRPWEQRLQDAGTKLEEDLRRLTTYINDEIIPDVRRHGSHALRAAGDELHRLAKHMDDQQAQAEARPDDPPGSTPRT